MENVEYMIHDLGDTMAVGKKVFKESALRSQVSFIEDLSGIMGVDIVYFGSVLQYLPDYRETLSRVMVLRPKFFFLTDHFMGEHPTFATAQVNMQGRRMAYRILQFDEIVELFQSGGYQLVYRSTNYQPYHSFENFDEQYRVRDSCNLIFSLSN